MDLLGYWAILWRRKFTILLTVIVAVGIAVGVDAFQTRQYASKAQLLFLAQGVSTASGNPSSSLSATQLATDVQLVQSNSVKTAAAKILGTPPPAVSVASVGTTQVANVSVTSANKELAARAADAYAQAYINVTTGEFLKSQINTEKTFQKQLTTIQKSIKSVVGQLAGVKAGSTEETNLSSQLSGLYGQQTSIQQQLTAIQLATSQSSAGGQLVQQATVATSPASPKVDKDAVLAGLIGLIIGIGFALLRDRLDDRIRSKDDLEKAVGGLPAIGLIPTTGEWRDVGTPYLIAAARPKSPAAEAYRGLRTSVQFAALDNPIKVLQVTSPASADGKTTTSANLAWTMAEAGQRVVLVGCDLRRPRIHDFFGLSNDQGMTNVLLGECSLAEALQPVPNQPRLRILASGPVPPNPSELLASRAAGDIFKALANHADMVILDSAPVLPVTDAAVLATQADAVILVAATGISTRRGTASAVEALTRVGASIVGVVLNRATEADAYVYYGYGYGYDQGGYDSYSSSGEPASPSNGNGTSRRARRRGASGGRHAAAPKESA